jgi:hypothetical protein
VTGHGFAKCSDAPPINMCQIGLVTRQSKLGATFRSCASSRLLLFLFLVRKSAKCLFYEIVWPGNTFCLALIASASLWPRREVTAIEQGTHIGCESPTFSCFARLVPLSFGTWVRCTPLPSRWVKWFATGVGTTSSEFGTLHRVSCARLSPMSTVRGLLSSRTLRPNP